MNGENNLNENQQHETGKSEEKTQQHETGKSVENKLEELSTKSEENKLEEGDQHLIHLHQQLLLEQQQQPPQPPQPPQHHETKKPSLDSTKDRGLDRKKFRNSSRYDGLSPSSANTGDIDPNLYGDEFAYIPNEGLKSPIFTTPPIIVAVVGRIVDSWPVKSVEYDIELEYNSFRWTAVLSKKSLYGLWFFVKKMGLASSFHTATSRIAGDSRHTLKSDGTQLSKVFVASHEKSISTEMTAIVRTFLKQVVATPELLASRRVLAILEVSATTFDSHGGYTSIKEGWLHIRSWLRGTTDRNQISHGQVACNNGCFNCFCMVKKVNLKRRRWKWVVLKESYLVVYNSVMDVEPVAVMLFDPKFFVEKGVARVGSSTSIVVSNNTFFMELDAKAKDKITIWADALRRTVEKSDWSTLHRDESFSPIRRLTMTDCRAMWLVDAQDTFEAIYHALCLAEKEIFIAGWWFCPELYLLRPAVNHPESRIDVVLKKKAEEGVKIYILLYKEVTMALPLASDFTKKTLQALHENICVLRDPDFIVKQLGLWSHHEKLVVVDHVRAFLGGVDLCLGRYDNYKHVLCDDTPPYVFPGKDYSNPRIMDFIEVDKPHVDQLDRSKVHRMPWHDVHCCVEGHPARDIARHFIQRWNYSVESRGKKSHIPLLVPHPFVPSRSDRLSTLEKVKRAGRKGYLLKTFLKDSPTPRGFSSLAAASKIKGGQPPIFETPPEIFTHNEETKEDFFHSLGSFYHCECQIVRSVTHWSAGCPTERSIQNAYIRLINDSRNFIYIENQFFITGLNGDSLLSNRIGDAIVSRIRRAVAKNEVFRVLVFMPLFPGFPGRPDEKDAYSLRGVLHWQYRSISRGGNSLYDRLYQIVDDPFEYLAFYGLRTHAINANNTPVTEEIYIHSKLMIVDDCTVIMGSANINERSMNGDRDSEVAMIIEDSEFQEGVVNGVNIQVGKYAHSLRMKLFEEHFGLTPGTKQYQLYEDPVIATTWFDMQELAMKNSRIYDAVFGCLPNDNILSLEDLSLTPEQLLEKRKASPQGDPNHKSSTAQGNGNVKLKNSRNPSVSSTPPRKQIALTSSNLLELKVSVERRDELDDIVGHVVYFPLNFLAKEPLEPKLYPAEIFN